MSDLTLMSPITERFLRNWEPCALNAVGELLHLTPPAQKVLHQFQLTHVQGYQLRFAFCVFGGKGDPPRPDSS